MQTSKMRNPPTNFAGKGDPMVEEKIPTRNVATDRRTGASALAKNRRILIVDDELAIRKALKARFQEEGAIAETAEDCATAKARVANEPFDLIVLDHRLPDGTGMALLEQWRAQGIESEFVMMTAYSSAADAVKALKLGAADYVMKPFDLDEMVLVAERALERRELEVEVERQRARDRRSGGMENLVGVSPAMQNLRALIERVAKSGARTILLRGESGTGKDLVARAIHFSSSQAQRPFLNITCTALPETLLESELFGHEKGAFTDAKNAKEGLFEQADGGTIFLDEIGDMPLSLQAKLLRFLESKQFRRLGGLRDLEVDVRIIAATNRDLEQAIAAGQFRSDLFYRLNVIPLEMPALRDRPEDVIPLAKHFLKNFANELRKPVAEFSPAACECLIRHDWPGNVRELRNCVERAVLLASSQVLDVADLPQKLRDQPTPPKAVATAPSTEPATLAVAAPIEPTRHLVLPDEGLVFDDLQRDLLEQALVRTRGNKSRAAALLGIHRDQVRYWVKKFNLAQFIQTRSKNEAAED
jgi:two-component system, NtrC family, response regulator AtoC